MIERDGPDGLEAVVERMDEGTADVETVSVGDLVAAVGQRSFGPLLLLAGVIVMSPLSGIPGLPTLAAIFVFTVSVQILLGREQFWLPRWLLTRSMRRDRLETALAWMRPVARAIDRPLGRRLSWLTRRPWSYAIAAACCLIALGMPPLEFVPFANSLMAAVIVAFGLALVTGDGLAALVAFVLTATGVAVVVNGIAKVAEAGLPPG